MLWIDSYLYIVVDTPENEPSESSWVGKYYPCSSYSMYLESLLPVSAHQLLHLLNLNWVCLNTRDRPRKCAYTQVGARYYISPCLASAVLLCLLRLVCAFMRYTCQNSRCIGMKRARHIAWATKMFRNRVRSRVSPEILQFEDTCPTPKHRGKKGSRLFDLRR